MKSKFFVLLTAAILFSLSCKKKDKSGPAPATTTSGGNPGANYKKLKFERTVIASNSYTNSYTGRYSYDNAGNLIKIDNSDSTYSGNSWNVNTSTVTISYSGSKMAAYSLNYGGMSGTINFVYDNSGKLRWEIYNFPGNVDTMSYSHNGNQSISHPKNLNVTSYAFSYYTNGDIDSSLHFTNGTLSQRVKYTRHSSNIHTAYAYFKNAMPLSPMNREIVSQHTYAQGNPNPTYSVLHSYEYSEGHTVKETKLTVGPNTTEVTTFGYY